LIYDILIIGSGLSSIFFLEGYKKKNEKIGLISYNPLTYKVTNNFKLEKKIKSNLPPRFDQNSIEPISEFFLMNKIEYSDKSSIFGLLYDGGVSNYWGMSCDFPKTPQLNFLNEKNRKSLIDSFNYIYNKYNFEGSVFNNDIQNIKDKRIEDFFDKFLKIKDSNISFYKNCSAINTLRCTKLNDQCWTKCPTNSTLLPNMMKNNYENIDRLNYFVDSIVKVNDNYKIHCVNYFNEKKIFLTKKLVLACGTIGTTRLILDMLTYDKPVKIYHNPMIFGCVLANENVKHDLKHWLAQVASNCYDSETGSSSVSNFRSANEVIKKKILKDYRFVKNFFFKKIYSIIENRIFFINLYIENKYSNLAIQKNFNGFKIDLIEKDMSFINKLLKKHLTINIEILKKNKLASYFRYSSIPRIGHDNHYTGTIKINNRNERLSVNEMCELNNFKNLYIIDGSVIPDNISFFPTGVIIANAHRVGSSIS
jgi:hypothetical protein